MELQNIFIRRGILNDTKADLLLFENAERSILALLERMKKLKMDKFEGIKNSLGLNSIEGVSFRVNNASV
ncbi:hypothetical protein HYS31_04745 [Candidatus Woesearchaeota archaeon]|nr:hypothetical protein [Candidatus Woesearchaeota archaeon]